VGQGKLYGGQASMRNKCVCYCGSFCGWGVIKAIFWKSTFCCSCWGWNICLVSSVVQLYVHEKHVKSIWSKIVVQFDIGNIIT